MYRQRVVSCLCRHIRRWCLAQLLATCIISAAQTPTQDGTCKDGPEHLATPGVALLASRWHHTAVKFDETNSEKKATPVQEAHNGSNPCPAGGCTNQSKIVALQKSPILDGIKKTLLHEQLSNSFASGWSSQRGGLSSTVRLNIIPEVFTDTNESSPPVSQDLFEPFGYPGAGLLLELHMPQRTLKDLHNSWRSSLAQFLLAVQVGLSKAGQVKESRLSILGIHGRYKRFENDALFHMPRQKIGHIPGQTHIDEEVVIKFEILPGWKDDIDPSRVLDLINGDLKSSNGLLMQGSLNSYLENATIVIAPQVGLEAVPLSVEHHGVRMSTMAWPIGISAAFIGVLICVAAY